MCVVLTSLKLSRRCCCCCCRCRRWCYCAACSSIGTRCDADAAAKTTTCQPWNSSANPPLTRDSVSSWVSQKSTHTGLAWLSERVCIYLENFIEILLLLFFLFFLCVFWKKVFPEKRKWGDCLINEHCRVSAWGSVLLTWWLLCVFTCFVVSRANPYKATCHSTYTQPLPARHIHTCNNSVLTRSRTEVKFHVLLLLKMSGCDFNSAHAWRHVTSVVFETLNTWLDIFALLVFNQPSTVKVFFGETTASTNSALRSAD